MMTEEHVNKELALYAPLISPGQALIMEDTLVDVLNFRKFRSGGGPLRSLQKYMLLHPEFELATDVEPYLTTISSAIGSAKRGRHQQRGSAANFEALDIGLQHASHDLVGLLHSDSIFLQDGWECRDLAALSTFEREANPFRPLRKKIRDRWRHLLHDPHPTSADTGKLMFFWLLTRKSVLQALHFVCLRDGHITPDRLVGQRNGLEVLSCVQISRFIGTRATLPASSAVK
jgi:hypothetical protein